MLLPIHIAAGGLAMVLGAVALSAKKGGTIHRRSGLLFVYAMLVMGITAAILGLRSGATGNVFGGLGTAYFVVTALTTVRPASPCTRGINVAGLTGAVGLALLHIVAGLESHPCAIRRQPHDGVRPFGAPAIVSSLPFRSTHTSVRSGASAWPLAYNKVPFSATSNSAAPVGSVSTSGTSTLAVPRVSSLARSNATAISAFPATYTRCPLAV